MTIAKRFLYFFLLNILIMVSASIIAIMVIRYFGWKGDLAFYLIFYGIIGMGGAFLSLALSRVFAKAAMGVKLVDKNTNNPQEKKLIEMIEGLYRKARLPVCPEIGIYERSELNAFATGPTKSRSLVAVSRGLLNSMNDEELEGVLAHEIAHIANGDMVTMALLQGMINVMVLLAARFVAQLIASQQRQRSIFLEHILFIVMQIAFSILGSVFLCAFSRKREYRADYDGAKLSGTESMIKALKALQRHYFPQVQKANALNAKQESYNYLQISGKTKKNIFSTHPPLELRIERLERMA